MTVYVDLDGVLADFDKGFEQLFGMPVNRDAGDVPGMWDTIRGHGSFFSDLDPLPDAFDLWNHVLQYKPIVLTGCPKEIPETANMKRAWVDKHLGNDVVMHSIQSRRKSEHCQPGDIIIDDWYKYAHLWIHKGGYWIMHKSAKQSIAELEELIADENTLRQSSAS